MINMVRRESNGNNREGILLVMGTSVMKICSISSLEEAGEVEGSSTFIFSMVDTSSNNKKRSYLTTLMLSSLI
jgi:hypothetical protein